MIGRTLSHYRILEEISRGGMGVVYRALDLKLNREVALKVLPPELVADPDRKRRFILEAQAAAALKHPNIAVIYEIDEVEGMTFMALELIEGEKLRDFARRERLPLARALELVIEVADGLARAHDKGIVHRDLKPANIMVTEDGHAKIFKDRPASWADAQQLTFDQAYIEYLDLSPDGKRLLVSSDRLGNPDLWALPVGGGEMQQLTVDLAPDWSPKWSPDAQQLAFYSYRTGNRDIWVMPSSGGPARQLTQNEAEDFHPAWSPSGREIAFSSPRGGHWNIWVVPAEGGEARQVTEHPADERVPQWSPDGRFLVFDSLRSGDWRLWRVRAEGGEPEPLTRGPGRTPRSSPDGKQIYFVGTGDRAGNLWALALAGRSERPLTKLTGKRGDLGQLSFATDGNHLLFTWAEDHGDLWVTELLR